MLTAAMATAAHGQAPAASPAAVPDAAPSASPDAGLTALLAKPISSGAVAALVAHANHPAAQARLAEALRDARAPVRAVAARVAFITASRGLLAPVRAALAAEADPEAANEMIRMAVTYGGAEALDEAWTAIDRLGAYRLPALTEALVRNNRPELLTMLPRIAERKMYDARLFDGVLDRTTTDPVRRKEAIIAFAKAEGHPLTVLNVLSRRNELPPDDLLAEWLRSKDARTRGSVLWSLVEQLKGVTGQDSLQRVGVNLDEWRASTKDKLSWEAIGVEVLARAAGRPPNERDLRGMRDINEGIRGELAGPQALWLSYLTPKELEQLGEARLGDRASLTLALSAARTATEVITPPMRMVPSFAPGLWRDLGALYGCEATGDHALTARIAYRPEGRPRSVQMSKTRSAGCTAMAGTLFSLTLYPEARVAPADYAETLVLPWQKDVVTCSDEVADWRQPSPAGLQPSGAVRKPKRIRHVDPIYPEEAYKARAKGVVTLEGIISPRGCMRDLRLAVSSSHPSLDQAGLMAVSQWVYTPTIVNGQSVPVGMSLSVNFEPGR